METIKELEYRRFIGKNVLFMENGFVKAEGILTTVYNQSPKITLFFKVKEHQVVDELVIDLNSKNKYEFKCVQLWGKII